VRAPTPPGLGAGIAALHGAVAGSGMVRALPATRDEQGLVEGLRAAEPWARAALFDRYAPGVERILRRMLGPDGDGELADLVQEVFVRALSALEQLRDVGALSAWMQTIAARTAYRAIRTRRARRWLRFWEPHELPEIAVDDVAPEIAEAFRRTYALLDRMPAAERMVFTLRHVEKLELEQIAGACEISLATVKRRLGRAQQRFARAAARDDVLRGWLEEGGRWAS